MADKLLPVSEALRRILDGVAIMPPETVPIEEAHGRVLAEDLVASRDQPPFHASAMDGYAVKSAELERLPTTLDLAGEAQAGRPFTGSVAPRGCVRIFTGAPVPDGFDTVVIQEDIRCDGKTIHFNAPAAPGANIRPRGNDYRAGDVLLRAGAALGPRPIMLAASLGCGRLSVRRKPTVAILATGDELVLPGETPSHSQIVCSNSYGLAAMAEKAGGAPRLLGIARDTRAALDDKIALTMGCDVLVTTGGASVGDHDLVAPALAARGMALDFWKIAMRPGKPMLFGRVGAQRVLGLPGNPVSVLICARLFLVPLIRALMGTQEQEPATFKAIVTAAVPANGPRQHYMRATLSRGGDGRHLVTPAQSQDSSLVATAVASNCLIVRAVGVPALSAGDETDVMMFDF